MLEKVGCSFEIAKPLWCKIAFLWVAVFIQCLHNSNKEKLLCMKKILFLIKNMVNFSQTSSAPEWGWNVPYLFGTAVCHAGWQHWDWWGAAHWTSLPLLPHLDIWWAAGCCWPQGILRPAEDTVYCVCHLSDLSASAFFHNMCIWFLWIKIIHRRSECCSKLA